MNPDLLRGNLELILLSILADGPKYGLEIISEATERTSGYFEFREGSLYPALHRLERARLVDAVAGGESRTADRGGLRCRGRGC